MRFLLLTSSIELRVVGFPSASTAHAYLALVVRRTGPRLLRASGPGSGRMLLISTSQVTAILPANSFSMEQLIWSPTSRYVICVSCDSVTPVAIGTRVDDLTLVGLPSLDLTIMLYSR